MSLVFELRDGHAALDSVPVLKGVNFGLSQGEFLTVLGGNGSGKTTLVRTLLGLVTPVGGSVTVFGQPLRQFRDWQRIGYVPQRVTAAPAGPASVMEIVLSGRVGRANRLRGYSSADREAAARALRTVDLVALAKVPVSRLSGGQQQRVLVARALAGEPEVLVLDEPFAAVDVEHQDSFAQVLGEFKASGGTVLLVSHGVGPIEHLVSREVVLESGVVVYDGPHHADHVHAEHVHHPEARVPHSPLDRVAGT